MRKLKIFLFVFLFIFIFMVASETRVSADIAPKPSVTVKIFGLEDEKYTATLVSKNPTAPYYTYEEWLEREDPEYEHFHPIMEYEDADGFRWVGRHWEMQGNDSFEWGYYPPYEFKIILLMEDGTIYSSQILNRYAFNSYFDFNVGLAEEAGADLWLVNVNKSYEYGNEILSFFLRLFGTILIEIGLLFIFGFRLRKSFKLVLIVNLVTQFVLNLLLNVTVHFQGVLVGLLLYILFEFLVIAGEAIVYGKFLKEKETWRAVLYGIVANLVSFGIGLVIFFIV